LKELDHRGKDACGYLAVTDGGQFKMQKAACRAKEFNENRRAIPGDTRMALVHTRFATQGHQGFVENNHPVYHSGVYCVHNGHISNDYDLFDKYDLEREAQVDSEVIPAMVGHSGWDEAEKGFGKLEGHYAVAMIHEDKPNEIIIARGSNSPLFVLQTSQVLVWASTKYAIQQAWKAVFGSPPADKRFREITQGTMIRVIDGVVTESPFEYQTYSSSERYSGTNFTYLPGNRSYLRESWEDDDYGTGSTWQSGRIFRDDPNWIRVGESSWKRRSYSDPLDDDVYIKYMYAYKDQKNSKIYIRAMSEGVSVTYTEAELKASPDWESWAGGYRKKDGFEWSPGTTRKPWNAPKSGDDSVLEAAATQMLANHQSDRIDPSEILIKCYSCNNPEIMDELTWEGAHGYCDACIEALTAAGMEVSAL
jgi:hypothetical protein